MILYIIKTSLLLFILITVYKLFLENEKMHHFNRIYLLGSLIFSLTIPLHLFSFKTKVSDTITHFQLNEILVQKTSENLSTITDNHMMKYTAVTIYLLVALLLIIRFVLNLYSFYKKIRNNEQQTLNGNKVILIQEPVVPHSFLNSIFLYEQDFKNNTIAPELIVHETVHVKQKHTLDILFIEVLQILFWFNPLIMLYKRAIKLNHEFLADETVNFQFNSVSYYQKMLINIASNQRKIALASSINYLITKKRLIMMTKKESKTRILLKTVGVGVIYSLLLFSFNPETIAQESLNIVSSEGKIITEITQPQFPGGIAEFYKFVGANFKVPSVLKKNGKIFIKFMVEKDGSLSEFKILRDIGFGTGEEAIRVLKLCPKWIPAKENNIPIRSTYSLPILIQAK